MARIKDLQKRELILRTAESLFAQNGYHNTSITDLKKQCGLPVGSIYTYFESKEDILSCIIEEGWTSIITALEEKLAGAKDTESRISILVDDFLPMILKRGDLIRIIIAEGSAVSRLDRKMGRLVDLILELKSPGHGKTVPKPETVRFLRTAIVVYFLGIMDANRLITQSDIDLNRKDILSFVRETIVHGLGQED